MNYDNLWRPEKQWGTHIVFLQILGDLIGLHDQHLHLVERDRWHTCPASYSRWRWCLLRGAEFHAADGADIGLSPRSLHDSLWMLTLFRWSRQHGIISYTTLVNPLFHGYFTGQRSSSTLAWQKSSFDDSNTLAIIY